MEYFHTVVLILKLRLWIPTGCEKDIEKTDNRCDRRGEEAVANKAFLGKYVYADK